MSMKTLMSSLSKRATADDPLANINVAQAARELHELTGTTDITAMPGTHIDTAIRRADRQVPWEYRRDISYIAAAERAGEERLVEVRDQLAEVEARREELLVERARRASVAYRSDGLSVKRIGDVLGVSRAMADRIVKRGD